MKLSIYQIYHPSDIMYGCQHKESPALTDKTEIKKTILYCIDFAKKAIAKRNLPYEEMIHKIDGEIVDINQILESIC